MSRQPFLERHGEHAVRVALDRLPFRIGRSKDADHTLPTREVSSFHAEIFEDEGGYAVRDLGSRNGTFVNGERIDLAPLFDGDIVHVAHEEFRFVVGEAAFGDERTLASPGTVQEALIHESTALERVLTQRAVTAVFQPIVRLADRAVVAYETLGRPQVAVARYGIGELFRIASTRGAGARLSRLFRSVALADLTQLPARPAAIFFNLHPQEMTEPDELDAELRAIVDALGPGQRAVIEIHESAVTDLAAMKRIRAQLRELGLHLAYDDFGAGQSRLMELVEVPPDFLKLDMSLVRDIDRSGKRQELVRALVHVMTDLGIAVLAEGVEREGESEACVELGCALGQGYLYGRPRPAAG
ncbi:MAG: EAL domain-containing protein [Myxococcales bacterium]|nr:EAL domain-containing protein [Myxococcales bacterium]